MSEDELKKKLDLIADALLLLMEGFPSDFRKSMVEKYGNITHRQLIEQIRYARVVELADTLP